VRKENSRILNEVTEQTLRLVNVLANSIHACSLPGDASPFAMVGDDFVGKTVFHSAVAKLGMHLKARESQTEQRGQQWPPSAQQTF